MNRKKLISIVVVVALIVFGVCGYFFYYTKTPAYSLGIIKDSIQKHDVERFKKHVDLDPLLSHGFDDFVAVGMDTDEVKNNPLGKNFADGIIKMIKPTIVSSLKDNILRSVEDPDSQSEVSADVSQQNNPSADIQEKTGMKSAAFKGIDYTKKDGKTATVGIKIYEPDLGRDFTLDIKMRELDDGTWQVVGISNLKDYLTEFNKAQKAALKSYVDETKVITDKYNAELAQIKATNPQSTASFWESYRKNLSACKEELSSVETSPASQKLADIRTKFYDAADQEAVLAIKIINGDNSADTKKQFNEAKAKVRQLSSQRDTIVSSVNNPK